MKSVPKNLLLLCDKGSVVLRVVYMRSVRLCDA
jgi:hypothetical protein